MGHHQHTLSSKLMELELRAELALVSRWSLLLVTWEGLEFSCNGGSASGGCMYSWGHM